METQKYNKYTFDILIGEATGTRRIAVIQAQMDWLTDFPLDEEDAIYRIMKQPTVKDEDSGEYINTKFIKTLKLVAVDEIIK